MFRAASLKFWPVTRANLVDNWCSSLKVGTGALKTTDSFSRIINKLKMNLNVTVAGFVVLALIQGRWSRWNLQVHFDRRYCLRYCNYPPIRANRFSPLYELIPVESKLIYYVKTSQSNKDRTHEFHKIVSLKWKTTSLLAKKMYPPSFNTADWQSFIVW